MSRGRSLHPGDRYRLRLAFRPAVLLGLLTSLTIAVATLSFVVPAVVIPLMAVACLVGVYLRWQLRRFRDVHPFLEQMMGLAFLLGLGAGIAGYIGEVWPLGVSDIATVGPGILGWAVLSWRTCGAEVLRN